RRMRDEARKGWRTGLTRRPSSESIEGVKSPFLLFTGAAPVLLFGLLIVAQDPPSPVLPPGLVFSEGPVNGVTLKGGIVVYRPAVESDKPSSLFLTHSRRDLVEAARRGVG